MDRLEMVDCWLLHSRADLQWTDWKWWIVGCYNYLYMYSFALCANHASNYLPSWLEKHSRKMYAVTLLEAASVNMNSKQTPAHRMLRLSQMRWLSRL